MLKGSQLIESLKILSEEERTQLIGFAGVLMFNSGRMRPAVERLLGVCLDYINNEEETETNALSLFDLIFPGQKYIEGKLEKVMVDTNRLIRNFLLAEKYFRPENEFYHNYDYSEILRERQMRNRYLPALNRANKVQQETAKLHRLYYHQQYLYEYAIHDYESLYNKKKGDINVPNAIDALELHFIINELALLNTYLLQQKVANLNIPDYMQVRLNMKAPSQRLIDKSPLLEINFLIFEILRNKNVSSADPELLLSIIQHYEDNLDNESLITYYAYLRNICVLVLRENPNQENIYHTLFELYKDNLERGYMHFEGKIHPSRYLAISQYAARSKNYEWALNFIEKNKNDIAGENETKDIYRLNLAFYYFGIGEFEKCLDHVPPTSPFVDYLVTGKRLELQCLYELKSDLFFYKLDAFKVFLSRTSPKLLAPSVRQPNQDFVNLMYQLALSRPGDKTRKEKLKARLMAKKRAFEWHWLWEKAESLH